MNKILKEYKNVQTQLSLIKIKNRRKRIQNCNKKLILEKQKTQMQDP